jgi:hypothetical protein
MLPIARAILAISVYFLTGCTPKIRYVENTLHPERSLEDDKYRCDALALQFQQAYYPNITAYNMVAAGMAYKNKFDSCLLEFGWVEVEGEADRIEASEEAQAAGVRARSEKADSINRNRPVPVTKGGHATLGYLQERCLLLPQTSQHAKR